MVSTPTMNGIGKQVQIIIVIIIIKLLLRHILMAKFAPRVTKHMRGFTLHHYFAHQHGSASQCYERNTSMWS